MVAVGMLVGLAVAAAVVVKVGLLVGMLVGVAVPASGHRGAGGADGSLTERPRIWAGTLYMMFREPVT